MKVVLNPLLSLGWALLSIRHPAVRKGLIRPFLFAFFTFVLLAPLLIYGQTFIHFDGYWETLRLVLGPFAAIILATLVAVATILISREFLLDPLVLVALEDTVHRVEQRPPEEDPSLLSQALFISSRLVVVVLLLFLSLFGFFLPIVGTLILIANGYLFGRDITDLPLEALRLPKTAQKQLRTRFRLQAFVLGVIGFVLAALPIVGLLLFPLPYLAGGRLVSLWIREGSLPNS